jgi:uncharacterized protein (TIGR01777 family)
MNIAISGSNGYIANNLIPLLETENHTVIRIKRQDLTDFETLKSVLTNTSVVINLAGAPILQKWTTQNKNEIQRSRTDSTQNIVHAINQLNPNHRPNLFISASAIGIYSPNLVHTEASQHFANGFVSGVVNNWEKASDELNPGVRKVIFRIGLVLGPNAKTIQRLIPIFRLGLGGKISSGKQPFPFVHINDAIQAFLWVIQNQQTQGIYNLVAPENIDNKLFTQVFAKLVNRHALFTVPAFILKVLLGEASTLLLSSPQVNPERLLAEGFKFTYPDIQSCLKQIIG